MGLWLHRPQDKDVICALATPPGEGALALIRLSGKGAFEISRKLCPFLPKKIKSHYIYFGTFLHPENRKALDEVLVFCFEKGRSFTGEESVEISCHGGLFLSSLILDAFVAAGARLAERGEFSYRSFMNGKMDLIQAESVLDIIQSRSPKAHRQAVRGLKGGVSDWLKVLEKKLLKLLSHLEASIDFSDQEIELLSITQQKFLLEEIRQEVKSGIKGFHQGRINREGFSVILLGAPNAGKSSLFNHLIQEDKAIITQYPGTTRDILSARFLLNQREFCLKDTAGFRKNPDPVEKKGIEKVSEEIGNSELCLFLVESALPLREKCFFGLEKLDADKTFIVFSKSDQLSSTKKELFLKEVYSYLDKKNIAVDSLVFTEDFTKVFKKEKTKEGFLKKSRKVKSGIETNQAGKNFWWISSHTGKGIESLKQIFYKKSERESGEIFLSTPRQGEALKKISIFLSQASELLNKEASPELTAFELQSALFALYELLGKEYNEEVIRQIFKEFCLGK